MLPFGYHLCVLESFFLPTTLFCSSEWFEVFLLTIHYFLASFSFAMFSVVHSMDFLCFISSSPFLAQFCSLSVPA